MDYMYYANDIPAAASDKEKISLLKCCANDALWHFLIMSLSKSRDERNPIVEWTGKHPWEIKIDTRTFASEWNSKNLSNEKFATLARNLQYYNNVKIGCFNLMDRHKKLGVYRFFPGYEKDCLPAISETELFIENKVASRNKATSVRYNRYRTATTQISPYYRNTSMNTNSDYYNGWQNIPEHYDGQIHYQTSVAPLPAEVFCQNSPPGTPVCAQNAALIPPGCGHSEFSDEIYNQYPGILEQSCFQHASYCMLPVQTPDYCYTSPSIATCLNDQEPGNVCQQVAMPFYGNQEPSSVAPSETIPTCDYQKQSDLPTDLQCSDSKAIDEYSQIIVEGDVTEFFSFPERLSDPLPSHDCSPNTKSSNDLMNLCIFDDLFDNNSFVAQQANTYDTLNHSAW